MVAFGAVVVVVVAVGIVCVGRRVGLGQEPSSSAVGVLAVLVEPGTASVPGSAEAVGVVELSAYLTFSSFGEWPGISNRQVNVGRNTQKEADRTRRGFGGSPIGYS